MLKSVLEQFGASLRPLERSGVTIGHIILLLLALDEMKTAGRRVLCQVLSLGEGTTRTVLGKLSALGVVQVSRAGARLSEQGKRLVSAIKSRISRPILLRAGEKLTLKKVNAALLIRGVQAESISVLEVRDDVIRFGGRGAVLLVKRETDLYIPPGNTRVSERYPSLYYELEKRLQPEDGDIILIGMGEESISVMVAILNAAVDILLESGSSE